MQTATIRERYLTDGSRRLVPLAWHHLRFEVPALWEVVGHDTDPLDGRLVLADVDGEVLQLSWKRLRRPPDVDRRLTDLVLANLDDRSAAQVRRDLRSIGDWRLYEAPAASAAFAGCYLAAERILLGAVMPALARCGCCPPGQLLSSFTANDGDDRYTSAFGMQVRLPPAWLLSRVDALPACQRLWFENRHEERIVLHRYGLAAVRLADDSLADFCARLKGRRFMLRHHGDFATADGKVGIELHYATRGLGIPLLSLLAKRWQGRLFAWQDATRQRIYIIEQHARPKQQLADLRARASVW